MHYLPSSILFIDSGVPDYIGLLEGLTIITEMVIISSSDHGLKEVTSYLSRGYETVYLICYGSPGKLDLGKESISLESLHHQSELFSQWKVKQIYLSTPAVGASDAREELIQKLKQITGAEVAETNLAIHTNHESRVMVGGGV